MKCTKEMGVAASDVFAGKSGQLAVQALYGETASLFVDLIGHNTTLSKRRLLDAGAFKGELMSSIMELNGHRELFEITATDINESALAQNAIADRKVVANLSALPFSDGEFDIACARYVLVWNVLAEQKRILRELNRVAGLTVLQHAGADDIGTSEWQGCMHTLLGGKVSKLFRSECHFSSAQEVECQLKELGIAYERIQHRRVDFVSQVLIERFKLDANEAAEVRKTLGENDYILQTTWLIK